MAEMMIYALKVSLCLMLFYSLYTLLLRRGTHFRFNRGFLLAVMILSLAAPAIQLSFSTNTGLAAYSGVLETIDVANGEEQAVGRSMNPMLIGALIYIAISLFLLARLIIRLLKLHQLYRHCKVIKEGSIRLAMCKEEIAPFSFFNIIFINEQKLTSEQAERIMIHERAHVRQGHSSDVLIAELFCALTWFNPFSWMLRSALKETHEYLADAEVSEQTEDSAEYFMLLLRNAIGVQPGLANNFNHSLIQKRIKMMSKPRSGRFSILKALSVIPVLILLLLAFSSRGGAERSLNPPDGQDQIAVMDSVVKMPEFPGGTDAMFKFIIDNVKYPSEAKEKGIQGKVFVSFTVTKTGTIKDVKVIESVHKLLDAEAVRVISIMPKWKPGETKKGPVDVSMTLPISFKLS